VFILNKSLILALMLTPAVAYIGASSAQIYKITDKQGNVIFTDTPPPDNTPREEIHLPATNRAAPPPDIPISAPEPEKPATIGFSVTITSPANETTIPMGPGNFTVSAAVEPAPGEDDSLQLFMDGTPWGEPQQAPSWSLTNVFRGAHDLKVALINSDGKHLATSEPLRVYVHRPSINFRNRN
jgi:hypothetical protein